jgi:hypothetical protein
MKTHLEIQNGIKKTPLCKKKNIKMFFHIEFQCKRWPSLGHFEIKNDTNSNTTDFIKPAEIDKILFTK